ncbi:MAG TPA: hypothetical protein VM432_10915 [Bdellovibrionales bacterium]|nr:hypothetical protein [Bdellovibrionales bacterium]
MRFVFALITLCGLSAFAQSPERMSFYSDLCSAAGQQPKSCTKKVSEYKDSFMKMKKICEQANSATASKNCSNLVLRDMRQLPDAKVQTAAETALDYCGRYATNDKDLAVCYENHLKKIVGPVADTPVIDGRKGDPGKAAPKGGAVR